MLQVRFRRKLFTFFISTPYGHNFWKDPYCIACMLLRTMSSKYSLPIFFHGCLRVIVLLVKLNVLLGVVMFWVKALDSVPRISCGN